MDVRPTIAAARHDGLTIALHWLTAMLVFLQFGLAELWGFFPQSLHHLMIVGHMSFGLILTAVFGLRVIRALGPGRRHFNAGPDLADRAARLMHRTLYVLVTAEIVLGVLTRWMGNQALSFFGLLIPSPFGPFSKAAGGLVDEIHDVNAWMIISLVGAHAAVALAHHYWLSDDVLRRMMPGK